MVLREFWRSGFLEMILHLLIQAESSGDLAVLRLKLTKARRIFYSSLTTPGAMTLLTVTGS